MSEVKNKTATKEKIAKALEKLAEVGDQALAKGHTSGPTVTTKVETFTDGKASPQLHHTSGNSDPGSWAGSKSEGVSQDDNVSSNGTDYNGGVKKSIMDLVSKGALSVEDGLNMLKAFEDMKGKGKGEPDGDEGDDDEEKDEKPSKPAFAKAKGKKVAKSFEDSLADNSDVIDASDVLSTGFSNLVKSLAALEERLESLEGILSEQADKQGSFNKSLGSAVTNLANALVATSERVEAVESAPARGPKSVQQTGSIQKSLEGDAFPYSKAQVGEALLGMLQKGLVSASDCIKFDTHGKLPAELAQKVRAHIEGK
jgi:hypothetical protein